MAEVYTSEHLSGSTSGRNIKVAATATAGTLLHTAIAGSTSKDEVFLWANNTSAADVVLTLEVGGVTSPDDLIQVTIPTKGGEIIILPGRRFNGGVVIRAFAATANVINIGGNVNRITVS